MEHLKLFFVLHSLPVALIHNVQFVAFLSLQVLLYILEFLESFWEFLYLHWL
jgi:hypothetical protein